MEGWDYGWTERPHPTYRLSPFGLKRLTTHSGPTVGFETTADLLPRASESIQLAAFFEKHMCAFFFFIFTDLDVSFFHFLASFSVWIGYRELHTSGLFSGFETLW